jgi:hypothetical protein
MAARQLIKVMLMIAARSWPVSKSVVHADTCEQDENNNQRT